MKIISPFFRVTFRSNLPFRAVSDLISTRIAPGGVWTLDKSGYYEEVPAMEMSPLMLGMALFLIEQKPSELYTLEARFVSGDRDVRHEPVDISSAIQLLIKQESSFELEP